MRISGSLPLVLAALVACDGRPRRQGEGDEADAQVASRVPHVAVLDLRGGLGEAGSHAFLGASGEDSFSDFVLATEALRGDATTKGVFVRFGGATLGMARAEELGRRLAPLRASVPVVCHADGYGNASLLAASEACSEVWLTPAGSVEAVGLAAQLVFAHALFDKLGVKVDFMQEGRFKGAEEPFTRDAPSEDARASLEGALAGIRRAWVNGVEHGRGNNADALGLEDGPYTADDAKARKLIDRIGFESEARERALELAGTKAHVDAFGRERGDAGIGEILRTLSGAPRVGVPHVAVIRATGAISMSGGGGLGGGDGISERELAPLLKKRARDPLTRAVVLRIDSPGGSALASDLLWRNVMDLRKEKPVVVSVGGMAASGGYYIASAANKIVAEKSSIIGSIGVVMGKLAVADSLASVGVHVTVVPARPGGGERAAYASPLVPWDDATRSKLSYAMKSTYRLFLDRIAEGRAMDIASIEPAAEGRIMSGEEAKERGLIDSIGGLDEAIALARSLAREDGNLPVALDQGSSTLFDLLRGGEGGEASRAKFERDAQSKLSAPWLLPLETLGPLREDVVAFAGIVRPILQGEHTLVATPFALSIK